MPDLYIEGVRQTDFRIEVDGTVEPGDQIADHPSINDFYDGQAAWIEFSASQSHELSAGGTTHWSYTGDITSWDVRSGDINVEVNGTSVTPGQLVSHYDHYPMDRVVIAAADDSEASFTAEVSGDVAAGSGYEGDSSGNTLSDTTDTGGWTDFYFDGDVTKLDVSGSSTTYLNCTETSPSDIVTTPYTPPQAAFNTTKDNLVVTFDASPSEAGSDPIQGYEWIIDNRVYSGQQVTHEFSSSGTYDVELTVYDNQGEDVVTDSVTVDAQQTPPTADFTVSKDGLTINLDGSASAAGTNPINRYEWLVDGTTLSGQTASYTFDQSGTYTVQLSVYDGQGLDDTTSTSVSVSPTEGGGGSTAALAGLAFLGAALVTSDGDVLGRVHDHVKDDNLGAAFDTVVDAADEDDDVEE